MFLITLVLTRWILPINEQNISQEAISALLLQFISAGSDIVDFYGSIEDSKVSESDPFVYTILGKFSEIL